MVQKKVANVSHKLGIQANILKTERKQAMIKPSIQNHDGKSKGADLKAIKMKKSRSIKRSNLEFSLHPSQKPGSPLPPAIPTQTPSPKKPLVPCKSPYTSPNYMKSTSSSEARKEKKSNISSTTSKLHRVAKALSKTSSSLKKMRTLTKAPSFKHTRSLGACKKAVLCHSDLDVQKATCSSTLKDSKFPAYIKLKHNATEAEGNSVFKVCPYSYCSLNGHHHMSAPPLKRFLSSRRKLLKSVKYNPDVLSPCKLSSLESNKASEEGGQNNDMFNKVYVPHREVATQVSESLSDEPYSEKVFQDNFASLSGMSFSLEDEGYVQTSIEKQTSFESLCASLDYAFGENSDMEWEEGQSIDMFHECETVGQTVYSKDKYQPDEFESNNGGCGFMELLAEEHQPYFHDEIVECLYFSDTDSSTDNEPTPTGNNHRNGMFFEPSKKNVDLNLFDEATINGAMKKDESTDNSDESDEENYTVQEIRQEEKDAAKNVMEESEPREETRNEAENCVHIGSKNSDNEETFNKVSFQFSEGNDAEVETPRVKDNNKTEEADDLSTNKQEANKRDSNILKRLLRCRKVEEVTEEEKEFNPREPNFLEAEPEPESEKVDLRRQEMDERRNAEEWMLDYALQKTVDQLAPARKRKVALLVEAFESVLPIPKCEANRTRSSQRFAFARTLQACS